MYLLPSSYRNFKDIQYELRSELGSLLIEEGVFNEVTSGLTVYVRERAEDGTLKGILVHDSRNAEAPITMMAERGAIADGEDGPKVVMAQGNRQELNRATGKLSMLYFDRYTLEVDQLSGQGPDRWRQPRERYLHELIGQNSRPEDRQHAVQLLAEANRRIYLPLLGFSLILVGLAFMLSGEFNRRGQTKRLMLATLTVAGIEAASFGVSSAVDDDLTFVPGLYIVALLPGVVAACVLTKGARPKRPAHREEGSEPRDYAGSGEART